MHKTCEQCYYSDKCASAEICEYYTPLGDDYDDCDIDDSTEARRTEFRDEWFRYIESFNN